MCGISGFLHFDVGREADGSIIKNMIDSIAHRGPDGEGIYVENNIALGHRRLAIIDVFSGIQPMYSSDKNIVLTFNGEIYNYHELRNELIQLGCYFQTKSDTEVIINAYRIWGIDCQRHFNGMWAFALWDKTLQQLFISRDRVGEKPVYYSTFQNTLIFGSEIKSLFAYAIPEIANTELLEVYLTLGYIPAPFTFFKDIFKLKAGHCLTVRRSELKIHQYWDLPEIDESNMLTNKEEIYTNFSNLFKDSVKLRMQSDVPYGAFLSGGLDSSSVVACMSEISSHPVETFTIGFKNKAYDERNLARQVAQKFGTNHHEYVVEPNTFNNSLSNIIYHYDEPFGDSSAIPTGLVAKFAASKVKMVLTGDGGDEVLSGYGIYQGEKFSSYYQKLPKWLREQLPILISSLSSPFQRSIRQRLNRLYDVTHSSNLSFQNRYISKASFIPISTIKSLTKGANVFPIEDFLSDFMLKCPYADPFYKLMYLNLKLSLPDNMLVKVDRMSMAYSIETRTPFLDHRLIEYMVHVHKDVKMQHFQKKSILRHSIGKKLPISLLNAPKRGFTVPLHEWFKDASLMQNLDGLKSIPFIDNHVVSGIISKNNSGKYNFGNFIWMLFVLQKVLKEK